MTLPKRWRPNDYVLAASFVINRPGHSELRKVSVESTEHPAHELALLGSDLPSRVSESAAELMAEGGNRVQPSASGVLEQLAGESPSFGSVHL